MIHTIINLIITGFTIASGVALGIIGIYKAFEQFNNYMHKVKYLKSFKREKDIYKAIQTTLHQCAADFVGFFQFHNTEHSIGNNGFLKVSMTQEAVREGLPPRMPQLKEIFIGQYMQIYEPLLDGKELIIPHIDEHKHASMISSLVAPPPFHVKSYLAVPIQKHGLTVGYISIAYVRDISAETTGISSQDQSLFSHAFRSIYGLKGVIENILN